LSHRFGHWPQSDIWSFGCILARVVAFGLEGFEGVDTFDQRFPGSQNPRVFDAIGGRDPEDVVLGTLLAQDWLTDLPGGASPQLSREVCGWIRDLLLGAVQVSMRRRPTARGVHGALMAIHRALQGQSDGSRVTSAIDVRSSDRQLEGISSALQPNRPSTKTQGHPAFQSMSSTETSHLEPSTSSASSLHEALYMSTLADSWDGTQSTATGGLEEGEVGNPASGTSQDKKQETVPPVPWNAEPSNQVWSHYQRKRHLPFLHRALALGSRLRRGAR
jgi:serine/threonine protein kinase